ncbi:MAG: hypothetical protein P8Y62_02615 [candidate division WOR-3 bacterium]
MSIIINTTIWFLIGAFLLNIVVLAVFRTGVVYKSRKQDGTLKKKIPFAGVLLFLIMLMLILTFFMAFDFFIFRNTDQIKYIWVLSMNLLLMLLLDFYDAFVIDILVLTKWRPGFLKLGKELTSDSMKLHVKKQLTVGWFIKLPLILISSTLFYSLHR